MTRQQTEKMKAYEEKAKELVSLTLNVCEERLTQPVAVSYTHLTLPTIRLV